MVVPLAGRVVAALIGVVLVLGTAYSVVGTLIVPRPVSSRMTRWVDLAVDAVFQAVASRVDDYQRRDELLAAQAPAILLSQLVVWLGVSFTGYALLLWPFAAGGLGAAFVESGSSMFTLGFDEPAGAGPSAIVFLAAASGLVLVALQVGYLPTLYAAFNRRETEVALLNARAGVPSWGPELLSRTKYALGTNTAMLDTLPDLYAQWERWAADVAESHATYLPLVRFRSPRPYSSWVTALLAVLDSAALYLSLSPDAAPAVPARLCLRGGFQCFIRIAHAMGIDVPEEPDPADGISLTYAEFLDGVATMRAVDFPIERDPAQAWPDFVGWRVNYERAAYAIAAAVYAVPAMWSGPRRHPLTPIPPLRPPLGKPPK
jgi:small basic protein